MTHCFSRRSFLKGSAAAAAALTSPLLPADAAFSETENGLFSPVSALCQTQYGPVKGREGENGLLCWYGIPYGAAPTGESRWTAPQEPARWHAVRDCTSPAPAAYQYTTFPLGTEDCLTLDIYSSAEAKKRPVLVYLHGSAATGSSLELPGSELVRDAGCVFVALNYRLGLFGWNCLPALTADPDATGNFALLDIARALDWVRDNIRRFGGDADNITLCGFSDGGRMAVALAASPLFRGRFQKAVAISGGLSLADPNASARQLAENFAPLAVEDGRFADTASAAEWLLTPGADVREWLCGLEPARIAALGKPAILYADDVVLSRGARSAVPLLLLSSATEFSGFVRDDLRPASSAARAYAVKYGSALCRWSSTEAVAEALGGSAPVWLGLIDYGGTDSQTTIPGLGSFHGLPLALFSSESSYSACADLSSAGAQALSAQLKQALAGFMTSGSPGWDVWTPQDRQRNSLHHLQLLPGYPGKYPCRHGRRHVPLRRRKGNGGAPLFFRFLFLTKQKRTSPIAFIGEVRSCFIQRLMPPTAFLISALFRYIAASASMNSSSAVMVRPACMA